MHKWTNPKLSNCAWVCGLEKLNRGLVLSEHCHTKMSEGRRGTGEERKKTEPTVGSSGNGTKFVRIVYNMTELFDERKKTG